MSIVKKFLSLLIFTAVNVGFAEVFTLSNGDRITGELVDENDTVLIVKTAFGNLSIPKANIQKEADKEATEAKKDDKKAKPTKKEDAKVSLDDEVYAPDAKSKEPEWIIDYRAFVKENFPENWQFRFRGGVEYKETTSSTFAISTYFDAKRVWELDTLTINAYYTYTTEKYSGADDYTPTTDKYGILTDYKHDFDKAKHWYLQNLLSYRVDLIKGIRNQVDEAVTVGYRFDFNQYDLTIDIAPGPAVRYINADDYDTKWVFMGVLAEELNWTVSKLLKLEQKLYLGVNVMNVDEYSLYFSMGLVMKATEVMDIALRYSFDYDTVNSSDALTSEQRLLLSFEFPFNWK